MSSTAPVPPPPSALVAAAGAIDARKTYGIGDAAVHALDGVTVSFEPGRFTAIMGPSGSGKSTLLHCLAGLDSLTEGAVFIGETYLAQLSDKQLTELRRKQVGFIFQAYNLIPTLTAEENITLPLMLGGEDGDRSWIDRVVDTVGLTARLKHRPSELSGGQQQRVAVAAPWRAARRSSSPTSPPATSTPTRAARCCASCAAPSTSSARRS
jgi:putative ABC transport system ATP-binding protein